MNRGDKTRKTDWQSRTAVLTQGAGNLPLISIENRFATCLIYTYGAHIASFQPKGEKDLLFVSPHSRFESGQPIRGGIPLCFPWFGKHPTRTDLPLHGVVRTQNWVLSSIVDEDDGSTTVVLTTSDDDQTYLVWPFHFSLTLTVIVAKSLTMILEVENTDTTSFLFEEAFHTYFAIGGLPSCIVEGLDGLTVLDRTKNDLQSKQEGPVAVAGEFVKVYKHAGPSVSLIDKELDRIIKMKQTQFKHIVIWNPGNDAAMLNPEIKEAWKSFMCVEQTNCLDAAVTLQSGVTHTSSLTLSVLSRQGI